jgi:hypothetical protein
MKQIASRLSRLSLLLVALAVCRQGHASAPSGRYTASNGTVLDTRTGLTWQQASSASTYTWSDAKAHCASLSLNGTGWRLPSVKELETLVDFTVGSGARIDATFPGTSASYFWSSSPLAGSATSAWEVSFGNGRAAYGDVGTTDPVRCVR